MITGTISVSWTSKGRATLPETFVVRSLHTFAQGFALHYNWLVFKDYSMDQECVAIIPGSIDCKEEAEEFGNKRYVDKDLK